MSKIKLTLAISTLLVSNLALADLNTGLVAHWSFDDCTAKDISGNSNDGIIDGSLKCTNGQSGKAFYFDGTGSTIAIPNAQSLKIDNAITISALISVDKDNPDGASIIQKGLSTETWDYGLGIYNSYPSYRSQDADWYAKNVDKLPKKYGKYHFVTVVVDENNLQNPVITYLDGVQIKNDMLGNQSVSVADAYPYGFINQSDYPLVIGVGHPSFNYKGFIDDIRVYNRTLTDIEIKELYNATQPISGTVKGVENYSVTCTNLSTKQVKSIATKNGLDIWDCKKAGLVVKENQKIEIKLLGNTYQ